MAIRIIKLLAVIAVLFNAMVAVSGPTAVAAPDDMVAVCHRPGTSAEQELTVNGNALQAHLDHGDTEGACGPVVPPPQPCNQTTQSGGGGDTTTVHELGTSGTQFDLYYNMYGVPDLLEVYYEGGLIYTTGWLAGGPVIGEKTVSVSVPAGSSTTVSVRVYARISTSIWDYTVYCPA